jgi:hypothetical protein
VVAHLFEPIAEHVHRGAFVAFDDVTIDRLVAVGVEWPRIAAVVVTSMPAGDQMRRRGMPRAVERSRPDAGLRRDPHERVRRSLRTELDTDLVGKHRPARVELINPQRGAKGVFPDSKRKALCATPEARGRRASGLVVHDAARSAATQLRVHPDFA